MNRTSRWFATGAALALLSGCGGASGDDAGGAEVEDLPYARRVESFTPGEHAGFGADALPDVVLGPPRGAATGSGSLDVLSLGVRGEIVLSFEQDIVDGDGPDFVVFENAFYVGGDREEVFAEPGAVAVSDDEGRTWHEFACRSDEDARGCAGVTPTEKFDPESLVPLDPERTGGDAFDLSDLGISRARWVRIVDVSEDGEGNTAGFDLDAVGLVHLE